MRSYSDKALFSELDSVTDQINQYLLEPPLIAIKPWHL